MSCQVLSAGDICLDLTITLPGRKVLPRPRPDKLRAASYKAIRMRPSTDRVVKCAVGKLFACRINLMPI